MLSRIPETPRRHDIFVASTLPMDLVSDIDRREKNRSKFVADAVRHDLDRRRREELRRSLRNPHPESAELADEGLDAWRRSLPEEDTEALVDSSAGKSVRWVSGEVWVEGGEWRPMADPDREQAAPADLPTSEAQLMQDFGKLLGPEPTVRWTRKRRNSGGPPGGSHLAAGKTAAATAGFFA